MGDSELDQKRLSKVEDAVGSLDWRVTQIENNNTELTVRLDRLFGAILGFGGLITAALMGMVVSLWLGH